MESMKILGIRVDKVTSGEAFDMCIDAVDKNKRFIVVTPNSEIIVRAGKNEILKNIIEKADLVVPDGAGAVLASKIMRNPLKERVTGIDLMIKLLKYANADKKSVYILGAKPEIVKKSAEKIKANYPNLNLTGYHHGYFKGMHNGNPSNSEEMEIVKEISQKKPDFLFVAMGSPFQEYFIDKYKDTLNSKVMMGVGGSLDVISGEVKRAPEFYQKAGLEWLYRVIKEPVRIKRMGSLVVFVFKVIFLRNNG